MTHSGGRRLSLATGLPLVIDLRDPWSIRRRIHEEYASPVYFQLADRYEAAAVRHASLVVANTEASRDAMRAKYPREAARIITVMNGYDEDEVPRSARREAFVIAYTGILYLQRDPRLLFRAAARVVGELGLGPEQFRFEFMGDTTAGSGVPIESIARDEGLEGYVRARPRRPRREALELLADAALLLVYPHNPLAIPSKVFEYMRYDAWLLALAEPGTPTETILRNTGADVIAPGDVDGMTALLRMRYRQFAAGERPPHLRNVEPFSRRNQAGILLDALEAVLSGTSERRP
jgi:glycosyltransferase involved in cell wall biosynthesis